MVTTLVMIMKEYVVVDNVLVIVGSGASYDAGVG